MYRRIVARRIRATFASLSRGDYEPVVRRFVDDGVLEMKGDHALGGERRGRDAVEAWFAATWTRYFPGLQVLPLDVVVTGPPWNTRIATRFDVRATLPDGTDYRNQGMQYLRLRWGRVLEDRLYEDTQRLAAALERAGHPA
jgi:ketosteroid isomerase-like protein